MSTCPGRQEGPARPQGWYLRRVTRRDHVAVVVVLLAAACSGHARVLSRDPDGGQLLLEGNGSAARDEAREKMAAHCGGEGSYSIVSLDLQPAPVVGGPEAFGTPWARGTGQYVLTYRCRR